MDELGLFFFALIVLGVFGGVLMFSRSQRSEPPVDAMSNADRTTPMNLHRGINSTSVAGEGLEGLPGLLMTIAFIFMFLSIFLPRDNQWFLVLFCVVEIGAAAVYLLGAGRTKS